MRATSRQAAAGRHYHRGGGRPCAPCPGPAQAARRAAVRDYANAVKPPYCDERKIAVALYDANNVKITSSSGLPGTGSAVTARSEATYNWFVLDHLVPKFPVTSPIRAKVRMRMEASQV